MGSDIDRRKEYASRTEPLSGWEAVKRVAFGLAFAGFAVVWTIGWVNQEDWPMKLLGCIGLLFIGLGVKQIWDGVQGAAAMRRLRDAIGSTQATVIDRYTEQHEDNYGNTYYTYHVVVQFDANRRSVTLKAKVSKQVYETARQDGTLALSYADADPHIFLLAEE
jgi:hypothetical protein